MVSIIIPVFNAEKYITKCLDSITKQTYDNYEIIMVNDGSTDGSKKIINEFSSMHSNNTKVFEQENKGQSSARNKALQYAEGEYVTFLDSDDYLAEDYLAVLVEVAVKNNSDMVCSGEFRVDEFGRVVSTIRYKTDKSGKCVLRRLNFSGKIYRKDFLQKHHIKFAEGKVYEDNPFNIQTFALAKNLKVIDYIGYYQTVHIGSTTTKKIQTHMLPFDEIRETIEYIIANKKEVDDFELCEYTIFSFFTYFLFKANKQHYYFDIDGRKSDEEVVYRICDYVQELVVNFFPEYYQCVYVKFIGNQGVSFSQSAGVWFFTKLLKYDKLKQFLKIYYKYK